DGLEVHRAGGDVNRKRQDRPNGEEEDACADTHLKNLRVRWSTLHSTRSCGVHEVTSRPRTTGNDSGTRRWRAKRDGPWAGPSDPRHCRPATDLAMRSRRDLNPRPSP